MYRVSTNISKENFKKMISGGKSYIPSTVMKALQEDKKGDLLHKESHTKQETLTILKFLAKKGLLSNFKSGNTLVQEATRQQQREEQKKKDLEKTKKMKKQKTSKQDQLVHERRVNAYGALELSDELWDEEKGTSNIKYDQRSPSNRILDELDQEKKQRDGKATAEIKKVNADNSAKKVTKQKPSLADINKLEEMDIG